MRDTTELLIRRIEDVKTFDNLFGRLYDDAVNHLTLLQNEVDRLAKHNEQLLQVIYQNQSELEDKC